MANVGKGSKVKFTLVVDGLGELSLKDQGVDFKVDFYAIEKKGVPVVNMQTVTKSQATADEEDDNTYYLICDTALIDLGVINGTLTVTYTDADTHTELKEIITIVSDVKVVDAPLNDASGD